MVEFQLTACHANRAGQASVTLRHLPSGATIMIHHVPFDTRPAEVLADECRRVQCTAAQIAQRAVDFLIDACTGDTEIKPVQLPGAAPREGEPPNPFGEHSR